jgi:hypothetical protein
MIGGSSGPRICHAFQLIVEPDFSLDSCSILDIYLRDW